jgi:hypothetical protein
VAGHCPSCGAPLASDQRYCLECGTRSPLLGSALADDLGALLTPKQAATAPNAAGQSPAVTPAAEPPPAGNTTAVIAGVGVLLLSMGVGVLIGRSSASASKAPVVPAQVISVGTSGVSSGGVGAEQTPAPTTTTPSPSKASSKHPAKKSSSEGSSSNESSSGGVGQTPSKPAPPSAAEHLRGSKGQSYEQKSKNLPNVISTG